MIVEYNTNVFIALGIYFVIMILIAVLVAYFYRDKK